MHTQAHARKHGLDVRYIFQSKTLKTKRTFVILCRLQCFLQQVLLRILTVCVCVCVLLSLQHYTGLTLSCNGTDAAFKTGLKSFCSSKLIIHGEGSILIKGGVFQQETDFLSWLLGFFSAYSGAQSEAAHQVPLMLFILI